MMNNLIILVDTDALIDMTPWDHIAKAREWDQFFSHLPEAGLRDNDLVPMLELAASEGAWIGYTSRWWTEHRDEIRTWMTSHGVPRGSLYLRPYPNIDPARLAYNHARGMAIRSKGARPVFVIHNDVEIAAKLRKRGIAALGAAQMPTTVKGFRDILQHARKVPNTKPTDTRKEN